MKRRTIIEIIWPAKCVVCIFNWSILHWVFWMNEWMNESLLSHKINNHISYVTTLKEGIYINYREHQDKNYKTRLCLKTKRLTEKEKFLPLWSQ